MITLIQIRKDSECLLSTESLDCALDFVEGLFLCKQAFKRSSGVFVFEQFNIDFSVDYKVACGDSYYVQFLLV